jgi:catechol 2,3-dioxygenase-like lactoylglutathione lyase family enzyme
MTSLPPKHSLVDEAERVRLDSARSAIAAAHLSPKPQRSAPSTRGVHHVALICRDVQRTVDFYQGILEMPLTEMFENRDLGGSTHFFFDIGNGNALAFFDLPGVEPGEYAEVLGGLHHLAISVEPERWAQLKDKLDAAGVEYLLDSGTSIYFRDPDGTRLELIADPLGEMYGSRVV